MAYMNSHVRIRGGRGRGFVQNHVYIPHSRSDQNKFETLSGLQDGDDSSRRVDDVHSNGFIMVRKTQRVNTGGDDNGIALSRVQNTDDNSDFDNMETDEKLSNIFNTLRCNQTKITHSNRKILLIDLTSTTKGGDAHE